jgi:hypothetical protein
VAVCELRFFDYQKQEWQKHSDSFRTNNDMIDEINRQRKEYQKIEMLPRVVTIPPKQTVIMRKLFPEENKELTLF